MANGFLVFDVETPNSKNNRICQLGYVWHSAANGSAIVQERSLLIDPEAPFDDFCYGIHGIGPKDVLGQPTFANLWERELSRLFADGVLVAHNAKFDLGVLGKTLDFYGLDFPDVEYIDTLDLARRYYPQLPDHKLLTVSSYLGCRVERHHDAASDALAAYNIMMETFRRHGQQALRPYAYQRSPQDRAVTAVDLNQIIKEIAEDRSVSFAEAWGLNEWLRFSGNELPSALCEELSRQLFDVLLDGVIDDQEEQALLTTFSRILHPAQDTSAVAFADKAFVLTGDFKHGMKPDIAALIESHGGIVKSGVTKKTDYVVIGSYGSERYNHGTYSTKVKKAMELQEQGNSVQIISESILFDTLGQES
jgi:DNA polymerase-3 subunit epsilon